MKSKFFRLAILFFAVLLIVPCLLVSPSPVWAIQANGGGGSAPSSDRGGSTAGGGFNDHVDRASKDLRTGVIGGAAGGAAATRSGQGALIGGVAGGVGKVVEGCTNCHDGSRPDKPGTTERVTLNRPGWFSRFRGRHGGE